MTTPAAKSKGKPQPNTSKEKKTVKGEKDDGDLLRLNVLLQELGVASRRKADTLIEQGRVQIDGKVIKQLGSRVAPTVQVKVDGKVVARVNKSKVVYLLNKPDKCLTSRSDPQGRPTIFDLPSTQKLAGNVQSVGRLDFRSEGLLLLTDDGDLAYALTHPKFSVEKKYAVLITNRVTIEDLEKLRHGVKLDDGMAKPLSVRLGQKEKMGASSGQWVEIIVTEGRNRLIRRMMEHIGLQVNRLVRIGIGDLSLPMKLDTGDIHTVTGHELSYLNEIKQSMLKDLSKKSAHTLTQQDILVRKMRRKMSLNDLDYEVEKERRNAQVVTARRRKRLDDEGVLTKRKGPASGIIPKPKEPAAPDKTTAEPKPLRAKAEKKPSEAKGTAVRAREAIESKDLRDQKESKDPKQSKDLKDRKSLNGPKKAQQSRGSEKSEPGIKPKKKRPE